jgi:hypothetical protein
MFATKCSFCQHDNTPGARFCADCGSPLHLQVCASCGKVSDVTAKACEFCQAVFPVQELSPAETTPPDLLGRTRPTAVDTSRPQRMNALPLVIVAIVAGGLPLLWFSRDRIPMPKAWQTKAPDTIPAPPLGAAKPVGVAPAASVSKPPAVATAPVAPVVPVVPLTPVAPVVTAPPTVAAAPQPSVIQSAASVPTIVAPVTAEPKSVPAAVQPKPTKSAPPAEKCTEAVAALGLCSPKR